MWQMQQQPHTFEYLWRKKSKKLESIYLLCVSSGVPLTLFRQSDENKKSWRSVTNFIDLEYFRVFVLAKSGAIEAFLNCAREQTARGGKQSREAEKQKAEIMGNFKLGVRVLHAVFEVMLLLRQTCSPHCEPIKWLQIHTNMHNWLLNSIVR